MARRSLWKVRLSESTVKLQRGLVSRYTREHSNESRPWISVLAMLEDARELVGSDDDDPAPTGPGRLSSRMIARGIWLAGRRARELGWTEADPRSWTREVLWRLLEIMPLDWPKSDTTDDPNLTGPTPDWGIRSCGHAPSAVADTQLPQLRAAT